MFGVDLSTKLRQASKPPKNAFDKLTKDLTVESRLVDAGAENDAEKILAFIELGVRVDSVDPRTGRNALHEAASRGHGRVLRLLLRSGASVGFKTFLGGDSPLHLAAHCGQTAACRLLMQMNAKVDQTNRRGWTPLHYAISGDCATALVDNGADVFARGADKRTPLETASARGDLTAVAAIQVRQEAIIRRRFKGQQEQLKKQKEVMQATEAAEKQKKIDQLKKRFSGGKMYKGRGQTRAPKNDPEGARRRVSLFAPDAANDFKRKHG